MNINTLRIDHHRFLSDFIELSRIGATPEGGANRPSFSDAHMQAREWFRQKTLQAGLTFRTDPAGNQSAYLDCEKPNARTLLVGSHLDSVYNGGRFDGALGVMAALEVLRSVKEANLDLPFNLEAIDFIDEEGTLVGMLGSQAVTGMFKPEALSQSIAGKEAVEAALREGGIKPKEIAHARREPGSLFGYLELHIEQGAQLHKEGIQIGVVTGIVGMDVLRVTFTGAANHAGTTAMHMRKDAGLGASALTLAARKLVLDKFPGSVVTVGQMSFKPGGVNIVPAEAVLSIDYRSVNGAELRVLHNAICKLAQEQANQYGLEVQVEKTLSHSPALMDVVFQDAVIKSSTILNLTSKRMPSGAGHDAQNMATICPCGMVFVPSINGISHSPFEITTDEDCLNGANVLLHTVVSLSSV